MIAHQVFSYGTSCFIYYNLIQNGRTALWQASIGGHDKVVEILTNAGAAVDVQNKVHLIPVVCFSYTTIDR